MLSGQKELSIFKAVGPIYISVKINFTKFIVGVLAPILQ